jgi:hypothetical protein
MKWVGQARSTPSSQSWGDKNSSGVLAFECVLLAFLKVEASKVPTWA